MLVDIYRENPVNPEFVDLAKTLQQNDKFIATCKISEENQNAVFPHHQKSQFNA
jgi:CHASE2 domain-containing sensor protein